MLSRVEDLEQVYILSSTNEEKLKPSPKVLDELQKGTSDPSIKTQFHGNKRLLVQSK